MRLRLITYSGMTIPLADNLLEDDTRQEAAEYLRKQRAKGHDTAIIHRGKQWEVITELNREGFAVTDADGILVIGKEKHGEV